MFFGNLVIRADIVALEKRPEGFHVVRVHDTAHILALAMIHGFVRKPPPQGVSTGESVFFLTWVRELAPACSPSDQYSTFWWV